MQKELHPEFKEATITCACGEEYKTMSSRDNIRVEVCSSCHPFYTGKKRRAAKGGRVERFNRKYGLSEEEVELEAKAENEKESEAKELENEEE